MNGWAQTSEFSQKERSIKAQVGLSHFNLKDGRLSALAIRGWAPSFALAFNKQTSTAKQQMRLSYASQANLSTTDIISFAAHHFNVEYSYEAKVKNQWIGGFIEMPTFLLFPKHHLFNNNPISYTMAMSIGPKMSKTFEITDKLQGTISAQTSLASYVIRPAYGHPYPEEFLDPESFHPTRRGMANKMIPSGKLLSLTKYQSINISLGLYYKVNETISLTIDGNTRIFRDNALKPIDYRTYEVLFGLEISY